MVLEGMPGAGKTSVAAMMAALGHRVIPEYVVNHGAPPAIGDDKGHQGNWERKEQLCSASPLPLIVDRNFLSSLAYAYSIRASSQGADLERKRVQWCRQGLVSGRFDHPRAYCVFDCPAPVSLRRRGIVAPGEHPWTQPSPLHELRRFYAHLADTLNALDPALSLPVDTAVIHLDGEDPLDANLRLVWRALVGVAG